MPVAGVVGHTRVRKLPSLSAFFPCRNEANHVQTMAQRTLAVLPHVAERYELIIVDDGSTDGTEKIADQIAASDAYVRVVHNRPNRGYGGALKAGFRAARHEYVFFTDGDSQFDPGELPKLVERVDEADMVVGYRIKRADPLHRLVFGRCWGLLVRALFGLKIRDLNCAFKLMPRSVIESVEIESNRGFMVAEMMCKLARRGYSFVEVGVGHYPQDKGVGGSPGFILGAFVDLFRLLWKVRRYR